MSSPHLYEVRSCKGKHGEECAYHKDPRGNREDLKWVAGKYMLGRQRPIVNRVPGDVDVTASQIGRADNAFQTNSGCRKR